MKNLIIALTTIAIIITTGFTTNHSPKHKKVKKIKEGSEARVFTVKDVYGQDISLEKMKGKTVYLNFLRNASCPVCNLRMHELIKYQDHFKSKNVEVIAIYESSAENMQAYIDQLDNLPFKFIPDESLSLYHLYAVEKSVFKFFKSMFKGAGKKMKEGEKLFHKEIEQDGNLTRIPAEFIIDKNGTIISAYYGKYVGDHMNINEVLNLIP